MSSFLYQLPLQVEQFSPATQQIKLSGILHGAYIQLHTVQALFRETTTVTNFFSPELIHLYVNMPHGQEIVSQRKTEQEIIVHLFI